MGAWDGVVLLIPYEPCRRTGASYLDCVLADDGKTFPSRCDPRMQFGHGHLYLLRANDF